MSPNAEKDLLKRIEKLEREVQKMRRSNNELHLRVMSLERKQEALDSRTSSLIRIGGR
jgi:predicted RNase H-like nuclease (RuvC/YqgF family)